MLPLGDGVVVDTLGDFFDHSGAEFLLHIVEHARGIKSLESRVGFGETLLRSDIVGEDHFDSQGQLGLGRIGVGRDGHRCEGIVGDFTLEFEITAFSEHSQSCLTLIEVTDTLAEIVGQRGIDQRSIVREVCHGDGVCGSIVDAGTTELVGDGACGQQSCHRSKEENMENCLFHGAKVVKKNEIRK